MLARDKHSSLLRTFVNYGRKKFYNIGPRSGRPQEMNETLPEKIKVHLLKRFLLRNTFWRFQCPLKNTSEFQILVFAKLSTETSKSHFEIGCVNGPLNGYNPVYRLVQIWYLKKTAIA